MADWALVSIVSTVAERLSTFLVNESAALNEVVNQVEWIERELRLMQAYLEHVDRHGQVQEEGVNEWAEELKDVARDAEDAIETFVIKSVKRRRKGVLSLVDRYMVGKELERIIQKMRNMSQTRINYEQSNIGVVVESPAETSGNVASPNRIIARAVEILSHILSQNLVTSHKVKKIVEKVKEQVVGIQNVASNLESTGEQSEREKAWLEEVRGLCNFTVNVAGDFILRKGRCASEWKLRKKMKNIRTQIGDAHRRKLVYGVGEEDVSDRIVSGSMVLQRVSLKRFVLPRLPFLILYIGVFPFTDFEPFLYLVATLCCAILLLLVQPKSILHLFKAKKKKKLMKRAFKTLLFGALFDFVIFIISQFISFWESFLLQFACILEDVVVWNVVFRRSVVKNLEAIQRDLALMQALLSDIKFAEGLNERQKVWVDQLRVLAQHADQVVTAYQVGGFFSKLKFAREINGTFEEIGYVSERKTIYGIANMKGRKGVVSLGETIQNSGSEINNGVAEHSDNSGSEEHLHAPSPASQDMNHVHEYRTTTGLKGKVQSIRREKQLMDALFNDMQEMGELDGRSKVMVEQLTGISLEIKSVINDFANKLEHKPIHSNILNYWTRCVIKKKINHIRNKIQDESRKRKTYGSVQFQTRAESFSMVQRLGRRTRPSLIVKESSIVGFDDDVEVLMAQLLSDEERRCIASIVGIGGTGKTTLARLIYENNAVKDHFHHRVWVSVPQNCTDKLLLEDIAKQVMEDQEEVKWASVDLTQILKTRLENKRYLIVVDNVQTSQVWDSLKTTIPEMLTGCRVLLTCRNPNVVPNAGPRNFVHQLLLLNDQDSWTLFRRNLNVDIPSGLIKAGKDIVKKCGGLPSAIKKMADLFSKKDATYEEWARLTEQLSEDQNPWFETLGTIDMNLSLYLRRCLFYFVLFPAEFEIPARRLIVLWVAEGLVHQGGNEDSPELVAERYLTKLIDLNMVQICRRKHNGKVKTCRLPNPLWKLWLTKASESKFLLQGHITTNSNSIPKASITRRVVDHLDENYICYNHIHGENKSSSTSPRTYYKDVLSFLSFDAQEGSKPGEDIGNFLYWCISSNCFLLLRVLDLEHVYKPQLPKNIGRLSQLRYLGLRWTYLDSLPSSISNLLKLQTLDLKHTYINTLTSSIWKMQLRHLYLSETYRSKFPPQKKAILYPTFRHYGDFL